MTNRLAQSPSLYLRKHAENPLDWWPWCDEAIEVARHENKPIFLSIGYSSCHWCTVMEGEAFSDPDIAEYMNANFIPIKVDREERPDLDSIYMQGLQMMVGQGGWPLNVFLDPKDLVPFYGGTYFPVQPRYGRPGFLQVLQAIRRYYDTEKAKLESVTAEIRGYLQQAAALQSEGSEKLDSSLLQKGLNTNASVLKGVGYGPSFPMMPYAQLVLRGVRFGSPLAAANQESENDFRQVCTKRGLDLALGGIYDHVAGGFHRYTVDPSWTVPHFEKMLYDNGQIVEYLACLWSSGVREPAFESAIAGTVRWLKREMTAPEGYFYAAQDADSFPDRTAKEPEEGNFYVWNYSELEQLLTPEELAEMEEQFTVTAEGNFEGNNVLQRRHPGKLNDTIETALTKLFQMRYGAMPETVETFPPAINNQEAKSGNWDGRIPPVTDTKMIVAWNSLMISGLARAYVVFGQIEYFLLAVRCANFILDSQWVQERFHRLNYDGKPAVLAQSEDYALFIKALLDLQQATLRIADGEEISGYELPKANFWLEKAVKVQEEFDEFLWSLELGGYYNTASDASGDLVVRERNYNDNATPSANGIAIANLVQLALLTEDLQYLDRAQQALQAFCSVMNQPQGCPSLFTALDWYLNHTLIRTNTEHLQSLIAEYVPTAVYALADNLPDGSVGLVCQGLSCSEVAHSREQLWEQVRKLGDRG
ncbi:thioredoxin domain-containing protein [Aerosakkonema sp. BLCC-F183]|uniref:thioredoxin domain-containing protein n=1 Tax=Aerosakkonema sp. BLCC-F183 TaxID=3342834 RepID=UPI0035BA8410